MKKVAEMTSFSIHFTKTGEVRQSDLDTLADYLDVEWKMIGSGVFVPPIGSTGHGKIVYVLRKTTTK